MRTEAGLSVASRHIGILFAGFALMVSSVAWAATLPESGIESAWAGAESWRGLSSRRHADPEKQLALASEHMARREWRLAADAYHAFFIRYPLVPIIRIGSDSTLNAHARAGFLTMGWCQLMAGDLTGAQDVLSRFNRKFPEYKYRFNTQKLMYFIGFRYFQIAANKAGRAIRNEWFLSLPDFASFGDASLPGIEAFRRQRSMNEYARMLSDTSNLPAAVKSPLKTALRIFSEILDQDPKSVFADQALFCSGMLRLWEHKPQDGQKKFQTLIDHFPQSPMVPFAYLQSAKALLSIQAIPRYNSDWDRDAEDDYTKAARLLAGAIGGIKRDLKQIAYLIRTRQARRLIYRAAFYLANNENRAAEIVLEKVVRGYPDLPESEHTRALLSGIH